MATRVPRRRTSRGRDTPSRRITRPMIPPRRRGSSRPSRRRTSRCPPGTWQWRGPTHTPYRSGLTRRTCPPMRPSSTSGPRRVRATPKPPSHSRSPDTWDGSTVAITSSSRRTRGTISCTRRKGVVASARATSTVENWGTSPCKTRSGSTRRSR